MSKKRKRPSGDPRGPKGAAGARPNRDPEGPPALIGPELLDTSTTDTTFVYIGTKDADRPSETQRMVAEVASERDRLWFLAHPGAKYYVRWSLPGEFPIEGLEQVGGPSELSVRDGRFVTVVLQLKPGARRRIPTIFMDGRRVNEPIPEEAWPEFHEVVTAPNFERALNDLVSRMTG